MKLGTSVNPFLRTLTLVLSLSLSLQIQTLEAQIFQRRSGLRLQSKGASLNSVLRGYRYHKQITIDEIYDDPKKAEEEFEHYAGTESPADDFNNPTEAKIAEADPLPVQLGFEAECALRETVVELLYSENLLETEPKTSTVRECIGSCYKGGCLCKEVSAGVDYLLELTQWNYSLPEGFLNKYIHLHNATECACINVPL